MRRLWIITGLFFMILPAFSQDLPTRCTYISSFNTPVTLDTLSVVPGSIYTVPEGAPLSYDLNTGMLTVRMAFPPDSIQVCYSVFPLAFDKVYRRNYSDQKDQVRTGANSQDTVIRLPTGVLSREEIFATQGLSKSGTLSRGISFGNNQDVFVNSTLNLNLDGRLTDDLNIRAEITDQNIPFQPE